MHLQCEYKLHGIIRDGNFEVRCDSRLCGKRPGVIVLHTIDLETGEVETKRYRDPNNKERRVDGSRRQRSAVRAP